MNKLRTLFRYLMTPKKFHSRQRIEKIQRKAIKRHIKFVRKNSPFYARHWQGLSDDEWSKFPIIDKSIMMDNLADLLTVRIDVNYAKKLADQAEKTRDFSPKLDRTQLAIHQAPVVQEVCILLVKRSRLDGQVSCYHEALTGQSLNDTKLV